MMQHDPQYIRFDWAAKRILCDKANFGVLEGFISVLLGSPIKIVDILESEGNQEEQDSKFNRVDIMARNDHDQLIIVEIQLTRQVHYLERILFGVGKALSDNIKLGEKYSDVKKVYSISILYFDFGEGTDYVYHGQTVFRGIHTGDEFTLSEYERSMLGMRTPKEVFPEYYLIRVNEFNKVASTPLEEWIEYLKSGEVRSDTTTPGLLEAREKLRYVSMSPAEKRAYNHYLDNIRIEEDCLDTAHKEGLVEGEAIGLEKGLAKGEEIGLEKGLALGFEKGAEQVRLDTARNLKALGLGIDQIAAATGLTTEIINGL